MLLRRLVACLLAASGLGCAADRQPIERVLLVTIDTLRGDALGCYGGPARTPRLDALADSGLRFAAAFAPAPLTLPSHASLFTALDPPQHGVRDNASFRLDPEIPTLAERFSEAGFATAAFVAAMVLDRQYGLDRGFDLYDDHLGIQHGAGVHGIPERPAREVVDAALGWLETAPDRFLLWVHLYDPHAPYRGPFWQLTEDQTQRYLGEVEYADEQLGRLLQSLDERWPGEATLVVFTSDHGESLGQHDEGTHSLGIYDATQRIPLLLRGARLPRGSVDSLVRLVDLGPTLLALAGLEPLPDVEGRSLLPQIRGGGEERLVYMETLATQIGYGWSPLLGLRSARWKYIRAPRPELYDLRSDPQELHDLAAERRELVAELDARLSERLAGARPVRPEIVPSADESQLLASLGYVAGPIESSAELGRVGGADPKDKVALRNRLRRVTNHLQNGRPEEAARLLGFVEETGPNVDLLRAEVQGQLGDSSAQERAARRVVEADPVNQDGYVLLGEALERQRRLDAAEQAYAAAVRLNPPRASRLARLGRVLEARGRDAAATEAYERALEARGGSLEALWRLAALRMEAGRGGEAAELLARVPPDVLLESEAALRLARAEASSGASDAARERLDRALARHPEAEALRRARSDLGEPAP